MFCNICVWLQCRRKVCQPKGALHVTASGEKKILMMGGTRFIGVFLARLLVKEGHQVLKIWFLTIGKPILLTVRMIEAQIITGRWLCLLEEKQPSPNSCQVNQTRIMLNFLPRYIMYLVYMNSHSFIPGFISIHSLLRNDQHVPSAWKLFLDFFFLW